MSTSATFGCAGAMVETPTAATTTTASAARRVEKRRIRSLQAGDAWVRAPVGRYRTRSALSPGCPPVSSGAARFTIQEIPERVLEPGSSRAPRAPWPGRSHRGSDPSPSTGSRRGVTSPSMTAPLRALAADVDPVRFEVIRNALLAITEEMGATLRRAAYSTNIKTRGDFSCAFFDRELRTIAQAFAQPSHLGSLAHIVPRAIRTYGAERVARSEERR